MRMPTQRWPWKGRSLNVASGCSRTCAKSVTRTNTGVLVKMIDGSIVEGNHALIPIGLVPNTSCLGLERVGIELGGATT